jgi:hypothetical protein
MYPPWASAHIFLFYYIIIAENTKKVKRFFLGVALGGIFMKKVSPIQKSEVRGQRTDFDFLLTTSSEGSQGRGNGRAMRARTFTVGRPPVPPPLFTRGRGNQQKFII